MAADKFCFKQFEIRQEKCAMKVGTDGVLLGAYVAMNMPPVDGECRIADVGTGTGLIALMLAQKIGNAKIEGIEIDEEAVEQARENVSKSPWSEKITITHTTLQEYQSTERFDVIVSNPPFFVDSLKNPEARRTMARHTDTLSMDELAKHAVRLLKENGYLYLILSPEAYKQIQRASVIYGLQEETIVGIRSKARKPVKRYIAVYRNTINQINNSENKEEEIMEESGSYSDWYKELTKDYYL